MNKTPSIDVLARSPPAEFNQLRDLIIEQRDKLPKRLAQVAAFAAEFPDEMAWLWRDYDLAKTSQEFAADPGEKSKPPYRVAIVNRSSE